MRHKLRTEFGLTAAEADEELDGRPTEVMIHLKIWQLLAQREEAENKKAQLKAR